MLTIVLVHRMAVRALPDGPVAARLIPVVFLATSWIYAGWATGGLETTLYAFVTMLGVSQLQTRATRRGAPLADGRMDCLPLLALLIAVTLGRLRRAPAMLAMAAMTVAIVATASKNYSEGRATELTMGQLDNYEEMDTPEAWAIELLIRDVETARWGHIVVDDIHVGRSKALKTN